MEPNQPNIETNPTPASEPKDIILDNSSKSKKPKALIAITVILTIFTIAGIATSIYFFMDASNKAADNSDLRAQIALLQSEPNTEPTTENQGVVEATTIEDKTLDNAVAQSIVNPYLKSFGYLNNALDYDFNEDTKTEISYLNVSPAIISDVSRVDYNTINDEFKKLFGSTLELAKKDYDPFTNKFTYDTSNDSFAVSEWAGGGTGMVSFSIVKSAYYDEDDLIIEVYHDAIPICDANANGGHCAKAEDDYVINSQSSIFHDNTSQIPVYKMIFAKDIDNYILKDIQKQ